MFCYNCGCQLSEHDYCTACGADVSLYKKIMHVSNMFYNEGLEKAGVRDLSGAINSLRQSLKFNKNNIEARNLLGLVYFEMGEAVAALSEWVISKNIRPEKNVADDYIGMIQSNASRLDAINQTIKKYNYAYTYCVQGSKDLAVIQLKKVLALNPKFIRAHLLLALLYMDGEHWEQAGKEIQKCLRIDRNNTQSLRYMKEVEHMLSSDEGDRPSSKRKKDETMRYQSDNEIIIQPLNVKENKGGGFSTILNILIGLVIGAAAMYFLAVPAVHKDAQIKIQEETVKWGNQLDVKTSELKNLENQIAALKNSNSELNQQLTGITGENGTMSVIDRLLKAAAIYMETENLEQTAEALESIEQDMNVESASEEFQNLYHLLRNTVGPKIAGDYREKGYTYYRNEDFEAAIEFLKKAVYYDSSNANSLLDLGNAYRKNGDSDEAIATYDQVIEQFPDTEYARRAQQFKKELETEE